MFSLLYAHPYGRHSYVNQYLIKAIQSLPNLDVADLYQAFPDFYINVQQQQLQLQKSTVIILQFPIQSGFPPALLVQYLHKVFCQGWAFGVNEQQLPTQALANKTLLVLLSDVEPDSLLSGADLVIQTLQRLARCCGMHFAQPICVPPRRLLAEAELSQIAIQYQQSLQNLLQQYSEA
jgi:putative NADPH-quinone reductase